MALSSRKLALYLPVSLTFNYAHPYRSSERGTNEAHNRMIRRDVPKGLSMDILGPHDIQAVESKLNNLPRR